MKECGIGAIINKKNKKVYIFSSRDLQKLKESYKKQLNSNKFTNKPLQKDWKKFGQRNFSFKTLEKCPYYKLDKRKNYYLGRYTNKYNFQNGQSSKKQKKNLPQKTHKNKIIKHEEITEKINKKAKHYERQEKRVILQENKTKRRIITEERKIIIKEEDKSRLIESKPKKKKSRKKSKKSRTNNRTNPYKKKNKSKIPKLKRKLVKPKKGNKLPRFESVIEY